MSITTTATAIASTADRESEIIAAKQRPTSGIRDHNEGRNFLTQ